VKQRPKSSTAGLHVTSPLVSVALTVNTTGSTWSGDVMLTGTSISRSLMMKGAMAGRDSTLASARNFIVTSKAPGLPEPFSPACKIKSNTRD
jgi:hypothetical protein